MIVREKVDGTEIGSGLTISVAEVERETLVESVAVTFMV